MCSISSFFVLPFFSNPLTENGDRACYPGLPSNVYVDYLCHYISLTNVSTQYYLSIDLIKNYDNILPPTIEKKRESECRVPIRKHTVPVDMHISRGRISVGAPTPEVLTAQQAVQKVAVAHSSPIQMTELESVDSL